MNARFVAIAVVAVGMAAWLGLRGCESEAEARVTATLEALALAAEAGDGDAIHDHLAADYRDRLGHDAEGLTRRILAERELWDRWDVQLDGLRVEVDEDAGFAKASFRPVFEGEPAEGTRRKPYRFRDGQRVTVELRRHGDRWLVHRAGMGLSLRDAL